MVAPLAAISCAVYWFHPVAWLVRRRLTELAEQICDDAVLQATGSRNEYAQNLLELAERLTCGAGRLRPIGVGMGRKASVVKRIEAIIDNDLAAREMHRRRRRLDIVKHCDAARNFGRWIAARCSPSLAADSAPPAANARESGENATEKPGEKTARSQPATAGLKGTCCDGRQRQARRRARFVRHNFARKPLGKKTTTTVQTGNLYSHRSAKES